MDVRLRVGSSVNYGAEHLGCVPRPLGRTHSVASDLRGDDGLVAESKGNYDQAEYDRQLEHGAPQR